MADVRSDFELQYPTLILFGWGRRRELPRVLAGLPAAQALPRVYLVASRSALTEERGDEIRRLCGGRICGEYSAVPHDPPLTVVDAIMEGIRGSAADVVLGVGGGSVLDAAKAAAAAAPVEASVVPFFRGMRHIPGPGLPFVAMPTTAGTGTEVTCNSVLTDVERMEKKSLRSPHMLARVALVDAELTVSQPPGLTAWTGLDALTQAVESYICLKAHDVSRALAAAAVRQLLAFLPTAVREGANRVAREAVAEGSLLSGMAFSQSGLGAVHGLAHPLGLALDLPHGLTCAILLPHILRLNMAACPAALDMLAAGVGVGGRAALVERIATLCRELGVPSTFGRCGLTPAKFPQILAACRSASMKSNPRHLSDEEITSLLSSLSA